MSIETDLEYGYPMIDWREPIGIQIPGSEEHFACRFCVALGGIKGKDIVDLPTDPDLVRKHIDEEHSA